MQWPALMDLPASMPLTYVAAGITMAIVIGVAQWPKRLNLDAFPAVGPSSWFGLAAWWGGVKYMTGAADIVLEGYRKHKSAPFKIATPYRWVIIVSSRAHIEELRNARDDELSFLETAHEDFNTEFTVEPEVIHNPYHAMVISSHLTRHLEVLYPQLLDEIITAMDHILDLKDNGWKSVPALATVQHVVCRASNRVFVGLPLCRDPDFVALNIDHTISFVMGGIAIGFFPRFLRPVAVRLITNIIKNVKRGVRHLRPVIEERRRYSNEYGDDWTEKPNDALSRLMDDMGPDATVESITNYVLAINIAAIHTTSNIFTKVLYNLASNPQYVQPLREEVESIVEKEGWSKLSLGKMRRIDSFLKESIRLESVELLALTRKAKKDFVFSDGTLIPKGARVSAALIGLHLDDALYENAEVFDGFRFANKGDEDGEGAKHQFAATSPEYLSFGHGRYACPGRFFAAIELKTMLAHIVTTYDVKLEENTTRPRSLHIGSSISANPTAKVMFRKRTY